jgi:hypothetical protein
MIITHANHGLEELNIKNCTNVFHEADSSLHAFPPQKKQTNNDNYKFHHFCIPYSRMQETGEKAAE